MALVKSAYMKIQCKTMRNQFELECLIYSHELITKR